MAIATAALSPVGAAHAALPDTLNITIKNNSGRGGTVYLYVLGQSLTTNRLGYGDRNGGFHEWPGGQGPVPVPAPDVAIPFTGAQIDMKIPKLSGRIYFSFGEKLNFKIVGTPIGTGLVQPAPWAAGDANRNILFDWSEYTYNDGGLWLNSSQVDMFAVPHAVGVAGSGGTKSTGRLKAGGYNDFLSAMRGQPGGWGNLIYKRPSDGLVLRTLAPGKGIDAGILSRTIMDPYITESWNAYRGKDLVVKPFSNEPNTIYYGRTEGNAMVFRSGANGGGGVVATFQKPATADVFGCDGAIQAINDRVIGPIARTLCAALNRGTMAKFANQPYNVGSEFYKPVVTNHYSRKIHARMADGKAYGFAFDDVGAWESLVHDGVPTKAYITFDPF